MINHLLIEVIFLEGKLNKLAQVSVGIDVVNIFSSIRTDICFIDTVGIQPSSGMTEPYWEVVNVKKEG